MYTRYGKDGCASEFPVRSKCIALFQTIDGVDVILFAMYVYEYDDSCPAPNRRRVYVSYLDSVYYFQPKCYRTVAYHALLIEYLRYVKARGFHTAHIWSCPPSDGDDYVFYSHPKEQLVPREDILLQWYHHMLEKAKEEGVVLETLTLYDEFFNNEGSDSPSGSALSPTCLPYFEGDYIPGEIENIIKETEDEEGSESNSDKIAQVSQDQVMLRLGDALYNMRQNFMVARLRSKEFVAAVERGEDVTDWIDEGDEREFSSKRIKIGSKDSTCLSQLPARQQFFLAEVTAGTAMAIDDAERSDPAVNVKEVGPTVSDASADHTVQNAQPAHAASEVETKDGPMGSNGALATPNQVESARKDDPGVSDKKGDLLDSKATAVEGNGKADAKEQVKDKMWFASQSPEQPREGSDESTVQVDLGLSKVVPSTINGKDGPQENKGTSSASKIKVEQAKQAQETSQSPEQPRESSEDESTHQVKLSKDAPSADGGNEASRESKAEAAVPKGATPEATEQAKEATQDNFHDLELPLESSDDSAKLKDPVAKDVKPTVLADSALKSAGPVPGKSSGSNACEMVGRSDSTNAAPPVKDGGTAPPAAGEHKAPTMPPEKADAPAPKSNAATATKEQEAKLAEPSSTQSKGEPASSLKRGIQEIGPTLSRHFAAARSNAKPVGSTADEDEPQETEMFESRQQFLNYCQANHFQFDELRRAKHSTMMVLFQLHNPSAPMFLQQCGACYRDITHGTRYHCNDCSNFDLCQDCYEPVTTGLWAKRDSRFTHNKRHTFVAVDMEAPEDTEKSRDERARTIKMHLELLSHAATCDGPPGCALNNCQRMKKLFEHVNTCEVTYRKGCKICSRLLSLLTIHARMCSVRGSCPLPFCDRIRERNRRRKQQQQQMDDRRRQAQNELYRRGSPG